jgi:hypothetical protein
MPAAKAEEPKAIIVRARRSLFIVTSLLQVAHREADMDGSFQKTWGMTLNG